MLLTWFSTLIIAAAGAALIIGRVPSARGQQALVGARMGPGCSVAEGIALLLLAIIVAIVGPHVL